MFQGIELLRTHGEGESHGRGGIQILSKTSVGCQSLNSDSVYADIHALCITDFDWGSLSASQLIPPPKETLTTCLSVAYPPLLTPSTLLEPPLREAEESQETVGPCLLPQLITSSAHPSTFSRGNTGYNGVYRTCHQLHHPLSRSIHGLH